MYIVFEIQTNNDGTIGTLVSSYPEQNQAESAYHAVLSAAAISALPVHSCVLLTEEGFELMHGCYKHEPQPEPTPEPEPEPNGDGE